MRCAGGEMRISHVRLKMELGMRRIARAAEDPTAAAARLLVLRRVAAGGRGERARGLECEMATEVVAALWRIGVLERDEVREAAEDQDVERESVSVIGAGGPACEGRALDGMGTAVVDLPASSSLGAISGLSATAGLNTSVKGVSGVWAPLPATAPTEFRSHPETVGVVVNPENRPLLRGMFSCGNGYVLLGEKVGESSGGGDMGECHDSILKNESTDSAGEPGSAAASSFPGSGACWSWTLSSVDVDEVRNLNDGAVAARREANAATLVRRTRSCPDPCSSPSSASDSFAASLCESLLEGRSSAALCPVSEKVESSESVRLDTKALSVDSSAATTAGPADCAFVMADLLALLSAEEGTFFVIHIGSRFLTGICVVLVSCIAKGDEVSAGLLVGLASTASGAYLAGSSVICAIFSGMAVAGGENGSGSSMSGLHMMTESSSRARLDGVPGFSPSSWAWSVDF